MWLRCSPETRTRLASGQAGVSSFCGTASCATSAVARRHGSRTSGIPQSAAAAVPLRLRHVKPLAAERCPEIPGANGQGKTAEEALAARRNKLPAKRFGEPAELGRLCAYLCSLHAAYISGQNIMIDGGTHPQAF